MLYTEFLKFILIGLANTVLGYIIYLVFLQLMNYRTAYSITYIIGIVIAYGLNTKFVFNTTFSWQKFLRYPIVYLIQYAVGLFFIIVLVEIFTIPDVIAPLLIVIITLPITFTLNRLILK